MQFFLSQQISVFLFSILSGLLIGVINEFFRLLRYFFLKGKYEIFITDIMFMVISAFITFVFALCFNKGYVRWFILLGEILGFLIFRYTIGLVTKKIYIILIRIINYFIGIIKRLFTAIVTIFGKIISFIMVKIPLINKSKKTACNKGGLYCIMTKRVNVFFKAFSKR